MKYVLAIAILLFSGTSFAQTVELDAESCAMLERHQPSADVSAEANAATDVHGKPVVEADLNKSPVQLPETMEFQYNVDLAPYMGGGIRPGSEALTHIGIIQVARDGSLTFNGEPMEGQEQAALQALCAEKSRNIKPYDKKVDLINQKDDLLKQ